MAWVSSIDPSGGAEADTETSLEEAAEESEGEDVRRYDWLCRAMPEHSIPNESFSNRSDEDGCLI